jgi:ATP-dependent helicase/nuclease subunit B
MEVTTNAIPWKGSAVESGVDWLVAQSSRKQFVDLSSLWVITQTSGASRRLNEALAQYAEEQSTACLLPRWSTPGSLIKPEGDFLDGFRIATPVQVLAKWVEILKENDLSQFPDLFPRLPQELDVSWGLSMAGALVKLRETLAEANHDCQSVEQSRITEKWVEQDRWSDLARLEKAYREKLEIGGMIDPMDARRRWVRQSVVPKGVKCIVLLGVSGFPDLGKTALENAAKQGVDLQSVIFCSNEEDLSSFDEFGRPLRAAWEARPLGLSDDQLKLVYGPKEQANYARDLIYKEPGVCQESLNIGVLDPEVKDALVSAGESEQKLPVFYDPEGTPGIQAPLYSWLKAVHELLAGGEMNAATQLLRFPQTLSWLESKGVEIDVRVWFKELDKLHAKHLSQTLEDGIQFAHRSNSAVTESLEILAGLVEDLQSGSFEDKIRNLMRGALSSNHLDQGRMEDQSYIQLLPKLAKWLTELSQVSGISLQERFSILLGLVASEAWTKEETGDEMSLHGWLELPWADSPHLVVLGCNDSFLPASLPVNTFVPQSLRQELGLWTDEDRAGRDAYLIHWLVASRKGAYGRIDFVMGKFSRDGTPLKPSALFFLCDPDDENELPNRTEKLFGEVPPEGENPAWAYPWKLVPGEHEPVRRISVTQFSSFLSCPFRFYLDKKFGMEEYQADKEEADTMDFGTLTHSALESLSELGNETPDEEEIYRCMVVRLEKEFSYRFGRSPSLSILQQKASIERRLRRVAQLHRQDLLNGWQVYRVEEKFHLDTRGSLDPAEWKVLASQDEPVEGEKSIRIVGVVDRIDFHPERGVYRLLDYKTSEKGPKELHVKRSNLRMEEYPGYFFFDQNEKTMRWMDLQLPLYRIWAEKALLNKNAQGLEVGIYNVPALEDKIGPNMWPELDDELVAAAITCAGGVLTDLLNPADHIPASKVAYDDFADLFFHSPEEAIVGFSR